jgi:GNAT superfamily N-acetyltransferase
METIVQQVDVASEKYGLIAFLREYLSPQVEEKRFDWLYLGNPDGLAKAWVASQPRTGQIVGVAAAFPRQICHSGGSSRGWVLGDFCIHPDHRSMGPALALQRACLEDLSEGEDSFCFDFPSISMLAIYRRLRIETTETMIRFAKPLRVEKRIAEKIPFKMIARGVSALANAGLELRDRRLSNASDLTIAKEIGPWGEEFTHAASQFARKDDFCVARTGPYLNWRFGRHPLRSYKMLTVRESGGLRGFLVYQSSEQHAYIVELQAEDDAARMALLASAIEFAREERVHTLNAGWLSSHRGRELLEICGFHPRESMPIVILELAQNRNRRLNFATNKWFLTAGDRES